ncbi:hypothetical protein VNO77_02392 [Canavalia gladiata]|uniref:Uncharacterized protein n=1 Tax=Canavalia gladiata TaxID=3824 RepID=A0AAN9MSX3_CANGL
MPRLNQLSPFDCHLRPINGLHVSCMGLFFPPFLTMVLLHMKQLFLERKSALMVVWSEPYRVDNQHTILGSRWKSAQQFTCSGLSFIAESCKLEVIHYVSPTPTVISRYPYRDLRLDTS